MIAGYRKIIQLLIFLSLFIGFASAGSSVGSGPGLSSLPTSFSWEGDSVLNGDNAGDYFDFSSSTSSILDDAEAAGMVMTNTGVAVNNSTSVKETSTPVQNQSVNTTGNLSGYASVGDIIKAQDWDALQQYTSGIDQSSSLPASQLSQENQNSRRNALFTEPQVISCGGCS